MGREYGHALGLLRRGEFAFLSARDEWLRYQNSFNDALLRRLLSYLDRAGLPGSLKSIDKNGQLITFGSLLDPKKAFAKHYPDVAAPFRAANDRRNTLPGSHPYSAKGGSQNRHLTKKERDRLQSQLSVAYRELPNVLSV